MTSSQFLTVLVLVLGIVFFPSIIEFVGAVFIAMMYAFLYLMVAYFLIGLGLFLLSLLFPKSEGDTYRFL